MTTEEKMLWSSLFAASFVIDGCVDEALYQAGAGISSLRDKLHIATVVNSSENLDDVKEMLGEG